jgi:CheY-like chemotaxis protein
MNRPKNIFLIEDDEHDQYFFTLLMRDISYAVIQEVATDGRDALMKLKQITPLPDIIFTDLQMPGMDGVQCLEAIQQIPELRHIPVVVLSTDTTRLDMLRNLGAKAFIRKTVDLDKLKEQVDMLIQLNYEKDKEIADRTFQVVR